MFYRCYTSWKKYCPDYNIIEWNESNFDLNSCQYALEAYSKKKYAFVTDYVRLWAIYNYGGIYLDTDVELVKPLDDLLFAPAYFGLEDDKYINTGLGFGARKGNDIVKRMLESYVGSSFIQEDGSFDMQTCPIRNTMSIASLLPPSMGKNVIININNAVIYPPEYFCPLESSGVHLNRTANTYSIHWFSASWLNDEEKIIHEWRIFLKKCEKYFGKRVGSYIARGIYLFQPKKRKILKKYS